MKKRLSINSLQQMTPVTPDLQPLHLLDPLANATIAAAYHAIRIGTAEMTFDLSEQCLRSTFKVLCAQGLIRYRNPLWVSHLASVFSELYTLGVLLAKPGSVSTASLEYWLDSMICPDPLYRAIRIRGVTNPFFTPMSQLCDVLQRGALNEQTYFSNAGVLIRTIFFKPGDSDANIREAIQKALGAGIWTATVKLLEKEEAGKTGAPHIKLLTIAHNNLFQLSVKGAKIAKQECIKSLITRPLSSEAKSKKRSTNSDSRS